MSERKKTAASSREVKRNVRKESEEAEVNDLARDLVRRQASKSSSSKLRSAGNSSESDSSASRFKTPRPKQREGELFPRAPKKVRNKEDQDVTLSDGSGDEGHKRTKVLMNSLTESNASEDDSDSDNDGKTVKELKKTVQNLKKRMKGSLKGQTVRISMSL